MRWSPLVAAAVLAAAEAAWGQTITYFWTVTTDDGDTDVGIEEKAYLSLWAHMEPGQVGFAGSVYDIRGIENWDTGELDSYTNLLWSSGIDFVYENNDIVGIEAFQLPPAFNRNFDSSNPIELYRIVWATDDYSFRLVEVGDTDHLNHDVYTDEFGTSVAYQGVPGVARFTVNVPGPGVVGVLGVAAMGLGRRRSA